MRVHLQALGCRLNEAELETWSRDFREQGYELADGVDDADLIVVNTCAVTEESVKKSRKLIRRAHRENPSAKLVMSGCYASLSPDAAAAELGVDLVVPNPDKDRLVSIATSTLELPTMPAIATEPGENSLLKRGRQRAFIKVQDGCRYRCTFCIVTVARGEERSRPIHNVISEIKHLHSDGIQEVVLAGVHLGGYGSDLGSNLYQLVEAVLTQTDIPRIRLGSLEPWDLPEGFWQLFQNKRLMPHLHLPLQSGADSVLRRMARRCKTGEYADLLQQAREQVEDFNVTTDIIVGFPGETEEEWQTSLSYVAQQQFGHIHIFAYSPREGTKAARLDNQLSRDIKRQRSQQLHDVAANSKHNVMRQYIDRTFDVLIEGHSQQDEQGQHHHYGYTPNFLRVAVSSGQTPDWENKIITVKTHAIAENGEHLLASAI